jgi:hypothetical protein
MMRTKTILEFLPIDAFRLFMGFDVNVPPICCGAYELMRSKKYF